jgi:hypothetical protein
MPEGKMSERCQSCGMEIDEEGTEVNGSPTKRYCANCYREGEFTLPDANIEQMIEVSARIWSNLDEELSYEDATEAMSKLLPTLERWSGPHSKETHTH